MVKSKLRNFFRCSFPVITAMLLIVFCAAPASSANFGSWGVPFDFSDIALSTNISTSLLGNVPFPLGYTGPTTVNLGGISVSPTFSDNSDNMINIDWSLSSPSLKMEISLFDVVVPSSVVFGNDGYLSFRFYDGISSVNFDADIFYKIQYPVNASGVGYALGTFQGAVSVVDASGVDLLEFLSASLSDNGFPASKLSSYILFERLVITFDPAESFDKFNMRQPNQSSKVDFQDWFDSYDYGSAPGDSDFVANVDFVNWLRTAVSGFLGIELWPHFSLDNLLWLCLVIGLLFTFLKFVV